MIQSTQRTHDASGEQSAASHHQDANLHLEIPLIDEVSELSANLPKVLSNERRSESCANLRASELLGGVAGEPPIGGFLPKPRANLHEVSGPTLDQMVNHAHHLAQTQTPLSDTTSPPGHPAEACSTVSRRMFMTLASVATASAIVTSPSIASAIPSLPPMNADSELIALGARFDKHRDAVEDAESKYNSLIDPREKQLRKLVMEDGVAYETARQQLGDDDAIPGLQEASEHLEELDAITDSLLDSILEIRPTTFAGIAVKLRVLRWLSSVDDEAPDANQDMPDRWFNVIDSDVQRLAGAPPSAKEAPIEPDPVFAAIGAQQHATWKLRKFVWLDEELQNDDLGDELLRMETSTIEALFRTRPTTAAGREAMIRHAVKIIRMECCNHLDDYARFVTSGGLIALLENLRLPDRAAA